MKVLILNTDYPEFIKSLYSRSPGLEAASYDNQLAARSESLFGVADFYSKAFKTLGHDAYDVHANILPQILAWYRECRARLSLVDCLDHFISGFRGAVNASLGASRRYVARRIRDERPDVVLNHDMNAFDSEFFRPLKKFIPRLIGQHACTEVWKGSRSNWVPFIVEGQDFAIYDLVVSSMPSSVTWFRKRSANAHLNRLAMDVERVDSVPSSPQEHDVTFVGSFSGAHTSRKADFIDIARRQSFKLWAPRSDLPLPEPISSQYQGEAYGTKMFQILKGSYATLNHHGNTHDHANNMRLFEATASRTALVTDWKSDIAELFIPGEEILVYRTPDECVEHIARLRADRRFRDSIANAGRRRCESEHTYTSRVKDLLCLI